MIKSLIWGVVLYESETDLERRKISKRCGYGDRWREAAGWRANEEVLQMIKESGSIIAIIRWRNQLGHIIGEKEDFLLGIVVEGRMEGKRQGEGRE